MGTPRLHFSLGLLPQPFVLRDRIPDLSLFDAWWGSIVRVEDGINMLSSTPSHNSPGSRVNSHRLADHFLQTKILESMANQFTGSLLRVSLAPKGWRHPKAKFCSIGVKLLSVFGGQRSQYPPGDQKY
jgi:hypothetical protein